MVGWCVCVGGGEGITIWSILMNRRHKMARESKILFFHINLVIEQSKPNDMP